MLQLGIGTGFFTEPKTRFLVENLLSRKPGFSTIKTRVSGFYQYLQKQILTAFTQFVFSILSLQTLLPSTVQIVPRINI